MSQVISEKLELIKSKIEAYPDFPKKGVLFWDIFSILRQPDLFKMLMEEMIACVKQYKKVDTIMGLDSRGFLFGTVIAFEMGIPFVPIRKKGKLPGEVKQAEYTLEYGTDILEVQANSISAGQNVVIVDDLLATGGTLKAACQLVTDLGGKNAGCLVVVELLGLSGRAKLPTDVEVHSLVQF